MLTGDAALAPAQSSAEISGGRLPDRRSGQNRGHLRANPGGHLVVRMRKDARSGWDRDGPLNPDLSKLFFDL